MPLAALAAAHAFAWTQTDPAGRAESVFLGLVTAGVLAVIASLGVGKHAAPELPWTALLATTTIWIAYQGPPRGAVVSLILVIGLSTGAARVLLERSGGSRVVVRLDSGVAVALALGLQLLMRSDLLLAPLLDPRSLIDLLAYPAAAGWAIAIVAGRLGANRALLAGGLAAVLAPGWTLTSTLAMVALAAGLLVGARHPAVRWTAVAVLALLPLWSPSVGLLFSIAALGLAGRSRWLAPLLLIATAGVVIASPQANVPIASARIWIGAVALVPAALLASAAGRGCVRLGAILMLAAAMVSKTPEAMSAGVALAALAVPVSGAIATLQRFWCTILVIGTALLAAYPWARADPRGDLLALLGWSSELSALPLLLALVPGLGLLLDRLRPWHPRWTPRPVPVAGLLLLWSLTRTIAPISVLVNSYGAVVLDRQTVLWQRDFPPAAIAGVVLDSHLIGGVSLLPGTEVAAVELLGTDGEILRRWPLRAGDDTAEWAAARSDLADLTAPPPWISLVAPSGTFFAQRFRSRFHSAAWDQGEPAKASRIVIRRGADLPATTALAIYRLELRQ